jgi:predicted nucleic acid-binding protein
VILYLDSSALVKLFVFEQASDKVHAYVMEAEAIATSRVAYSEACAAFARRRHEDRLSQEEYSAAKEALRNQWPSFGAVELAEFKAGELAMKHNLRGFDAIHLAAALELHAKTNRVPVIFCTFDTLQAKAARAERLTVVP